MTEPELPVELIRFIHSTVPTYQAAVVLVLVARDPGKRWTLEEVASQVGPAVTTDSVRQYVDHFDRAGLLRSHPDGSFQHEPASDELREAAANLVSAYDTRPVTLVRVIYSIATAKIQSFADAFKLKRD